MERTLLAKRSRRANPASGCAPLSRRAMADVLAGIVARKRLEVSARLGGRPVAVGPTKRRLKAALGRPGARFIMEVKKASPSGHRARFGLDEALAAYAPVADAISVLTDGPDFG